ncbi:rCG22193 [Rattus norvegicus]|uniref:RCG22193 n=1 Tax=Rattus norvegicus TaxID=10116 RepID=A6INR4_RAT|nr:rCG22193 [Rattus norvegicus]
MSTSKGLEGKACGLALPDGKTLLTFLPSYADKGICLGSRNWMSLAGKLREALEHPQPCTLSHQCSVHGWRKKLYPLPSDLTPHPLCHAIVTPGHTS